MVDEKKMDKRALIGYFLNVEGDEVRSTAALATNLDAVLKQPLNPKELALVLYHATSKAQRGVYGEDPEESKRIIVNKIHPWVDKAIKMGNGKDAYNGYTVAHMLDTFRRLNTLPPQRFTDFVMSKAVDLIPTFSAMDMSFTLSAIAHLGLVPDNKFLAAVQKRLPMVQSGFTSDQAYGVMWSLAVIDSVLDHHHGKKHVQLSTPFNAMLKDDAIRQKLAAGQDSDTHRNMLSDSILWFTGNTSIGRAKETDTSSLFEGDVSRSIGAVAGARVLPPRTIKNPEHRIDLTGIFNQKNFMIECDGPTHFVRSPDDHKVYLNGPTIFQTALISRAEPDTVLVRVPYDSFYKNAGNSEMWEMLMLRIEEKGKGSFILGANGDLIPLGAGYDSDLKYES